MIKIHPAVHFWEKNEPEKRSWCLEASEEEGTIPKFLHLDLFFVFFSVIFWGLYHGIHHH